MREYIEKNNLKNKITLIINSERKGALANIYYAAMRCPGHKVICLYDGDDWLAGNDVLAYLADLYNTYDIWLTYGQFMLWPARIPGWCAPFHPQIIKNNMFRNMPNIPSHLRTFYAWLFHKINLQDLLHEGNFYTMTWDQAIMYPLIEMAGERHYFVSKILYVYNDSNPINDHKVNVQLQRDLARIIRSKERYQRLDYKYPANKGKKKIKLDKRKRNYGF